MVGFWEWKGPLDTIGEAFSYFSLSVPYSIVKSKGIRAWIPSIVVASWAFFHIG